jgi:hypothetical protein
MKDAMAERTRVARLCVLCCDAVSGRGHSFFPVGEGVWKPGRFEWRAMVSGTNGHDKAMIWSNEHS